MSCPEEYSDFDSNKAKLALIKRTLNKERGKLIKMSKFPIDST